MLQSLRSPLRAMPSDALSSWSAKSSKSSKAFPCLPDSPAKSAPTQHQLPPNVANVPGSEEMSRKNIWQLLIRKGGGFHRKINHKSTFEKNTSTKCWCSLEQSGISHGHSSTINHCQPWTSKNSRFIVRPQLHAVSKQWPWKSKSQRTKSKAWNLKIIT